VPLPSAFDAAAETASFNVRPVSVLTVLEWVVMAVLSIAKRFAIATGVYRPARRLARRIRPQDLRTFLGDVELYRSLLPPGALCFDVGANMGEKSEAMLKAGARVVAFEPNPLVLPELRARCGHYKNWSVLEAAVGEASAITTFYARESSGQSSLAQNWEGKITENFAVPVVTLDSAIEHFGRPFFCKIDVEGWELEVLTGLTQSIPLMAFEFHLDDPNIRKTKSCLDRLIRLAPSRVNVTPSESSKFHLREWVPLGEFLAWFPGDLHQSLPGKPYGDIFVKRDGT
jgi:FkbM family methyltransferase